MAATDLLVQEEISSFLGHPDKVGELNPWISAVSDRIDDLVGPVVIRTVTDIFDGGYTNVLLRHLPAATITTVTEGFFATVTTLSAETATVKPTTGYLFDTNTGLLYRRSNGYDYPFWPGRQSVVVTYQAGRYASTSAVTGRFKQAAKLCLEDIWQKHMGTGNSLFTGQPDEVFDQASGWVIPKAAFDLLGYERRLRIGIG